MKRITICINGENSREPEGLWAQEGEKEVPCFYYIIIEKSLKGSKRNREKTLTPRFTKEEPTHNNSEEKLDDFYLFLATFRPFVWK